MAYCVMCVRYITADSFLLVQITPSNRSVNMD